MSLRVAMLSVHTCPLAALGGKETGGMNVYVRELARELGRMGVEVDVFTRSQNRDIPRVVSLGERARVIHLAAGPEAPIARERIHEHLDQFADGVEAWRATHSVDYDLIHAHYWLSGEVALRLRARRSTPVVAMFHTLGRLKNRVAATDPDREPDVRIAGEARVIAETDRLVAANVVEQGHLVQHYDADPARIAVIPCGVDTDLFCPGDRAAARRALGIGGEPLLLYVGRLAPIKGLDTLLVALACLRVRDAGARLLIVGGEADEAGADATSPLARRAAELGLAEAVTFVGPQPQDALPRYYTAADATVLPSYYESFGMVALEAMACASPVVASRVGGLQTTVRDGVTGFLVPEGDACALAAGIERLLGDRDLAWRVGREGVRWAAQHRWPCVAEAIVREYAALADGAGQYLAAARCR